VIETATPTRFSMTARNKKFTIYGYANRQLLDVTEVKGIVAARNISALWESTGRFSEVTFKPKNI
tara:strand:- start:307 stop:501 length:195 start_codon:yes stop_codon:yes gene_type:complete